MDDAELADIENTACPTCGSCSGMYTANTMNCLTEALGMGLPGNGTIPAVYSERLRLAKLAGMQAVEVLKANLRPKDIMTREAFENAVALDMALGGSSNTALHLPAIAHEAGVPLSLDDRLNTRSRRRNISTNRNNRGGGQVKRISCYS